MKTKSLTFPPDSNPGSLDCESGVLPLSYRAPYKKVDDTFSDIPGVTGISDDIIVVGYHSDGSDHDANPTAVLERARATGLCFNDKTMVVRLKRIPFFGNIIGDDGIEPDPEKVTTICNMTAPTDVKELQTGLPVT